MKREFDGEQGAVAVLIAILLVVLLGFVAIVIDLGRIYAEKAQLQNGADAAALSIAQVCAIDESDPLCSTDSTLASSYAEANVLDGLANVELPIGLETSNDRVTAVVNAQEIGGQSDRLSLGFAKLLGFNTAEVKAKSTAVWGAPSKAQILVPLAIAECKFNLHPDHLTGAVQLLDLDTGGCGEIPGGFSWINKTAPSDRCSITITAGGAEDTGVWFDSKTGASMPTLCTNSDIQRIRDQTVLLPLFDTAMGNGSSGKYYVKGFAAFHITGYKFPSETWWSNSDGLKCNNKCIKGYFVKRISLSEALEIGNEHDYGALDIHLAL